MRIYRNYKRRKQELEVQALGCVFAFIALFLGGLLSALLPYWNPLLSILIIGMLIINAVTISAIAFFILKQKVTSSPLSDKILLWVISSTFLAIWIGTLPFIWQGINSLWLENYGISTEATIINQKRVSDANIISYDITYKWEVLNENGNPNIYVGRSNIEKNDFESLISTHSIPIQYLDYNPIIHQAQEPYRKSIRSHIFLPVWFYVFAIISAGIYLASQTPRNKYYSQANWSNDK